MNLERRNKYGGQGSTIVKSGKLLDLNLDVRTLDIMCKCLVTNNQAIRRGQLINLRNLIYMLNPEHFVNDYEKTKRIRFIKRAIDARLNENLSDPYMILSYVYGGILDDGVVNLDEFKGLTGAEINWVNNMVSEALKFSHVYVNVDTLLVSEAALKTIEEVFA